VSGIRLGSISMDCADPGALGEFWAKLLGGTVAFSSEGFVAVKTASIWLSAVQVPDYVPPTWPEGEVAKQIHLDLAADDLESAALVALELGARRAEVQPAPERYLVFLDPAGHPFCLSTQIPE